MAKYVPEPFRIKMVEPITRLDRQQREAALKRAHYNLFNIRSDEVFIDLLTDSGTGAMSQAQWAAMLEGDEAYAGARSYQHLKEAMDEIFGFKHFVPTHQGRAAENILTAIALKEGQSMRSNMHFDTAEGNIRARGGVPVNLVNQGAYETEKEIDFKGDMDLEALENFIAETGVDKIPFGMITITNNAGGGQPVSFANLKAVSEIYRRHKIPFFIDACRFAENAYFIKLREEGFADKSPLEIAQAVFALADGATMSAKKDALVNIGGFLALNDDEWFEKVRNELILREGFITYGGLAGRDLDAMAVGLREGLREEYLEYRLAQTAYLGDLLSSYGVPIMRPPGAHAIYLDAAALLPHLERDELPGQSLSVALYLEGGIRGVELGTVAFGYEDEKGETVYPHLEMVRLALPRRMYTQSHLDVVADTLKRIKERAEQIRGMRIVKAPKLMRHFTAQFAFN